MYDLGLAAADETFLVYLEERFSFAETLDMARRLARALREEFRLRKGDRIAICARNSPEWCLAYMAATMLGAIAAPLNSWSTARELEFLLADSGSRLIFVDPARLKLLGASANDLDVVLIRPEGMSGFPETFDLLNRYAPLSDAELRELERAARRRCDAHVHLGIHWRPERRSVEPSQYRQRALHLEIRTRNQ